MRARARARARVRVRMYLPFARVRLLCTPHREPKQLMASTAEGRNLTLTLTLSQP